MSDPEDVTEASSERRGEDERRSATRQNGDRRRGRPRSENPLKPVTLWLPSTYADKLDSYAVKHDISTSSAGRRLLILRLNNATD